MNRRDQQRSLKQKIKSRLKRWGHLNIPSAEVFSRSGREAYLAEHSHGQIREQVGTLYEEFQKIPGIGPISAHTFDAYYRVPHRFATKQKLWRYCKLDVRKHSSGGTQVRREKLDPAGRGELKALSHRVVKEALGGGDENEVQASLLPCLSPAHRRRDTRSAEYARKVLSTMWGVWKNGTAYNPDLFYNLTRSQPTDSSG